MMQVIVILVLLVLIVLFVKNTKEAFEDKDYLSKIYNQVREGTFKEQAGGSDCAVLDGLKDMRAQDSNYFLPCNAANNLSGVSEDCKEKYCKELGYCKYEGGECKSECNMISSTDKNETEKKKECLDKRFDNTYFRCDYDDNVPLEKEKCHTTSLNVYESNIPAHKEDCKLVDLICETKHSNNLDSDEYKKCIKDTCDMNRYCETKDNKCVSIFKETTSGTSSSDTPSSSSSIGSKGSSRGSSSRGSSSRGSSSRGSSSRGSSSRGSSSRGSKGSKGSSSSSSSGAGSQTTGWYSPYNGRLYSHSGLDYGSDYVSSEEYNKDFMNSFMYYNDMNNSLNRFMNSFYDTDLRNVNNNNLTDNFNTKYYNEINNFNSDFNNEDYTKYYNNDLKKANNSSIKSDTSKKSAVQEHVKGIGSIFIPSITIFK